MNTLIKKILLLLMMCALLPLAGRAQTLTGTTVNTGYILQNQGSGPMFYDAEGVTFSLPAGRCYLTPPASGVKAFAFNFGDATGIEEFQGTSLPNRGGGEALFVLSGRKIESPARGIYIQGTRKVVVK